MDTDEVLENWSDVESDEESSSSSSDEEETDSSGWKQVSGLQR